MTEAGLAAALLLVALVTAAATGPFPAVLPLAVAAAAVGAGLTRRRIPLGGRAEAVLWLPGLGVVLWGLVDPFATGIGREGGGAALSGASTVLLGYGLFLALVMAWSDVGARVEKLLCVALGIMVVLGRVPFDLAFAGLTALFGLLGAWFLVLRRRGTMAGAREARRLADAVAPPDAGPPPLGDPRPRGPCGPPGRGHGGGPAPP